MQAEVAARPERQRGQGIVGVALRALLHPDEHHHFAALGELDGVADQIDEDLPQANRVADHEIRHVRRDVAGQLQILGVGAEAETAHSVRHRVAQLELDGIEVELAGLYFGEVEDVVDDGQQAVGRAFDHLQVIALLDGEGGFEGELSHAEDAVHGRADLMAHVGQEIALGPVGRLRRLLGALERQGRAPAFGHVGGHAEEADDLAGLVAESRDRLADREAAAVLAAKGPFAFLVGAAAGAFGQRLKSRQRLAEFLGQLPGVLRDLLGHMEQLHGVDAEHLFRFVTEHPLGAAVEHRDLAVGVVGDDGDLRGGVEDGLQSAIALGQHLGRLLERAEIAHVSSQQGRPLRVQHRKGQVDRKFAAVLAQADGFDALADPMPFPCGQEMFDAAPVRFAQRRRHDAIRDPLPQHFLALEAEHFFGRRVEFDDTALVINGDDAVQRVFEDRPRAGLALLHLLGERSQVLDFPILKRQRRFQLLHARLHPIRLAPVKPARDEPEE